MFVKTLHKSALKTGGQLAALAGAAAALLIWPQAVAGGVSRGLSICGTVIIPSLFPFLVLGRIPGAQRRQRRPGTTVGKAHPLFVRFAGMLRGRHPGGLRGRAIPPGG